MPLHVASAPSELQRSKLVIFLSSEVRTVSFRQGFACRSSWALQLLSFGRHHAWISHRVRVQSSESGFIDEIGGSVTHSEAVGRDILLLTLDPV